MKKVGLIILSILLFVAFSGCEDWLKPVEPEKTNNSSGNNTDTLSGILNILVYGDETTLDGKAFMQIAQEFMRLNPGVSLLIQSDYDEAYSRLLDQKMGNGTPPDIFFCWNAGRRLDSVINAGEAVDHRSLIDSSRFLSAATTGFGPNGELWTVPLGVGAHTVMYANEDLLTELGLQVPATYAELAAQVSTITNAGYTPITHAGSEGWTNGTFFYSLFLTRFGGPEIARELKNGTVDFNSGASLKALEMIEQMVSDGLLPQAATTDYTGSLQNFLDGTAVYLIDGGWRAGGFSEVSGVAERSSWNPFPALPGESSPGILNGGVTPGYSISKSALNGDNSEAVKAFWNFLYSDFAFQTRARVMGTLPSATGVTITEYGPGSAPQDAFIQSSTDLALTLDSIVKREPITISNNGIIDILNGTKTAQEIADATQNAFQNQKEVVSLNILAYGDFSTSDGQAFDIIAEEYLRLNPDIRLNIEREYDEAYSRMLNQKMGNGTPPDIFFCWNAGDRFESVRDAGEAVDHRSLIDSSRFLSAATTGFGPNGELWTVPLGVGVHTVMYANEDLLTELGLQVPTTYAELAAQVSTITNAGYTPIAHAGAAKWTNGTFFYSLFLARFGGHDIARQLDSGAADFNSGASLKALEMIEQMVTDGLLPQAATTDYAGSLQQFLDGNAVYLIDGGWRAGGFADVVGVAERSSWNHFPALPGESYPGYVNGGVTPGYSISKSALNGSNSDAAKAFWNFLYSDFAFNTRARIQGTLPSRKDVTITEYRPGSAPQAAFIQSSADMALTLDTIIIGDPITVSNDGIIDILNGTKTAQEIADATQTAYFQQ